MKKETESAVLELRKKEEKTPESKQPSLSRILRKMTLLSKISSLKTQLMEKKVVKGSSLINS